MAMTSLESQGLQGPTLYLTTLCKKWRTLEMIVAFCLRVYMKV
jgi:hypothetical protein